MTGRILELRDSGQVKLYEDKTNGSSSVAIQAPATLAGDIAITLHGSIPTGQTRVVTLSTSGALGVVASGSAGQFLHINGSGSFDWSNGTETLQSAYDNGETITGMTNPVSITQTSANNALNVIESGAGNAVGINQVGAGNAVNITQNGNGIGLLVTKTSLTGNAIQIANSGNGQDINATNWNITKAGTANVKGLVVSSNSGYGISITNAAATNALYIDNGTSYNALYIKNSGNSSALYIDQSGGSQSILISLGVPAHGLSISKTNTGTGNPVNIVNAGTGQGINITQQGAGIGLQVTQQAALQGIYINKSNTAGGSPLDIVNAGVGNSINITQNGNGVGLAVNKTNTGNANLIDLTNAGTGYDIDGNASNWYVDKSGNAVFNQVNGLPVPNVFIGATEGATALTGAYAAIASVTLTIPTGAEAIIEVFSIATLAAGDTTPNFRLLRGATPLWTNPLTPSVPAAGSEVHSVCRCYKDASPGTGSVTFTLQAHSSGLGDALTGTNIKVTLI